MNKVAIIIPARLASTRFPRKMLAEIAGRPMVICVANQAKLANAGDVFIACAELEIAEIAKKYGYEALMTDPELATGSDRVQQAALKIARKYDIIMSLQGDVPLIDPKSIKIAIDSLSASNCDIATLAAPIREEEEKTNPNVVKAIVAENGRALYFTRSTPYGEGTCYHHIGVYAYRKEALNKFVSLPRSPLEKRENLEQLRALENGMTIQVTIVDDFPHGVDLPEDLAKVLARIDDKKGHR